LCNDFDDSTTNNTLKDKIGRTPLSLAAGQGHESAVKLLLEKKGAEVDSKDSDGRTPLFWAAGLGHESAMKLLLEKGAEVDSKDNNDWTPLSVAVGEGDHESAMKLLLYCSDYLSFQNPSEIKSRTAKTVSSHIVERERHQADPNIGALLLSINSVPT
jgi:ankyrin repeat protein